MSAVVEKVTGKGKQPTATAPEKVTATAADTQAAMQRQASLRARRGMGGLFSRSLGDTQDTLGG
jgi:hypothetical protein